MKAILRAALLCTAALVSSGAEAWSQDLPLRPAVINVQVNRFADLGEGGYEVRVEGVTFSPASTLDALIVTATAPDGTFFHLNRDSRLVSVPSLSIESIVSRFAGDWTITETIAPLASPSAGTSHQHRFQVSEANLTTFPLSTPSISSPINGAKVPRVFSVVHNGVGTYAVGPGIDHPTSSNTLIDLGSPFYDSRLPQVVEVRTSLATGGEVAVVPLDSNPPRLFRAGVTTRNWSSPVHVTVGVPEPSTLAMTGIASLSLAVLRRRK